MNVWNLERATFPEVKESQYVWGAEGSGFWEVRWVGEGEGG